MQYKQHNFLYKSLDLKSIPQKDNSFFGVGRRFQERDRDVNKRRTPGPGHYKDINKWNKRTFNVNFLAV